MRWGGRGEGTVVVPPDWWLMLAGAVRVCDWFVGGQRLLGLGLGPWLRLPLE